jgi:hypothetical protein
VTETPVKPKGQGAPEVTYKDELENRRRARKTAQHQNKQDQPTKLASRKEALLAHFEKNIRDLGVTIETDDQTGTIGLKHAASSEIVRINVHSDRYMLHTSKERGGRAHDVAGPVTALTLSEIDLYLLDFLERGGVN